MQRKKKKGKKPLKTIDDLLNVGEDFFFFSLSIDGLHLGTVSFNHGNGFAVESLYTSIDSLGRDQLPLTTIKNGHGFDHPLNSIIRICIC